MDYCLLQDVFPDWKKNMEGSTEASIAVGCTDTKSAEKARKEQKEQKKKAKKCKDPALRYLEPEYSDPDRPFLPFNKDTQVQKKVPGTGEEYASKKPAYFGASEDDELTEGFSSFTNVIGSNQSQYEQTDLEKEVQSVMEKSSGKLLPSPSLQDAWKPLTPAGVHTAFYENLLTPEPRKKHISSSEPDELSKKIDSIFGRLELLEAERRQSTQTEVLLFVGSGLALILSLDILSRI
jgi:hypothetical protein